MTTTRTVRPSRLIMGYEAYTVSFFRHAHDGREGWEARYDGRTQGWFWTEEEAWDRLRALAKEYGDLPDEDFDVKYGKDAQGLHTATSPQYRGLLARGVTDDEAMRKLVGMINLVRWRGKGHWKGREIKVGTYTVHIPEHGRPVVVAEGSGDYEKVACDPLEALVAFAKEIDSLRNPPREEPTEAAAEDFDPSTDPDVVLCDHVRDRVLGWKPANGRVPPDVAAVLPDIAALAALSLLDKLRERASEGEQAIDHPFAGLAPQVMALSPEAYDHLMEVLENPPPPTEKLRQLMRTHALWEKGVDKGFETPEGLDP